jgi:hypothetical protein
MDSLMCNSDTLLGRVVIPLAAAGEVIDYQDVCQANTAEGFDAHQDTGGAGLNPHLVRRRHKQVDLLLERCLTITLILSCAC